jgi:GNAT superfamily N-acetyltransferase
VETRAAVAGEETRVVDQKNDLIIELGGAPLPVPEAISAVASFINGDLDGAVIVAVSDDELVGVCTISYQPSIRTLGTYAIIQEMFVAPDYRSEKLGERLIEAASSAAEDAGCPMVELSTPPNGERAENFYSRVGFTQVGVRMRRKFRG